MLKDFVEDLRAYIGRFGAGQILDQFVAGGIAKDTCGRLVDRGRDRV